MPLRIFFQGKDANPQYFDGKLNPFLLFLSIFAIFRVREGPEHIRHEIKVLWMFSVLFFGFALFSSGLRMRYISPIIPPLVILSVYGIRQISEKVGAINSKNGRLAAKALATALVAATLWINAQYIIGQFKEVDPFGFLSGSVSRDDYIEKYRFEYPAIKYINRNLPHDAKIFFIFMGKRGYYCDKEYQLDNGLFYKLVKRSDSPENILTELKNMGITHLLIRYDIFDKWVKNMFNDENIDILQKFRTKYCKMLFFKWGYGVSRLESFPI